MTWRAFDDGKTIGELGSEEGRIVLDEEHTDGARITLERGGPNAPFSITCGIYGCMAHTRYFRTESEARSEYTAMAMALANILAAIPMSADPDSDAKSKMVIQSIEQFIESFP